ncbi:MAG: outer membrane protein assembly factor BamA, partial [Fibrobacter sp.]|nr:outer membrane protein assembly factor BamA [Fibrobacter sp.]
ERKLKTKENRWWRSGEFNKDLYKEHLDTLILFYNDLGYLDASIVKDSVWYGEDKKDIYIDITVNEGKKYYAGNFFFSGNQIMTSDSLQARISLKKGKPFQKSRFELSKYMIENVYREEGYLWVRVDDQRSYRGDTIDVNFYVYEGHPAIVRKIDIKGNTKTMEKVIRREIDLLPGKKYKQSLMMRSRQKINSLNYFSEVKPDLIPNEDGTIDLVFEVTEKDNIGQLQLGAAYSGQSKFVGTFSTSIPNFRGAGQRLDVNLEIGREKRLVNLGFSEPWAFDIPLALSGNVFYDREIRINYDTIQSYGFVIGAGRSKLKWPDSNFKINGSYKLSFERNSIAGTYFSDNKLRIMQEGYLNQISLNIERYDLDMPLFPTKGDRLTITPRIAYGPTDRWFRFFKGTVEYEHYLPLPGKFVLGSRSKFGLITKLGKEVRIGKYDLFTAGGTYSDADIRGYEDWAFGGESTNPENSLALFATTLELRYPILEQQVYLALFADAGNTWASLSKMSFGDLYKSIGIGARINVPMLGIIGCDFGYGLDDLNKNWFKNERNKIKFHFIMNRGF